MPLNLKGGFLMNGLLRLKNWMTVMTVCFAVNVVALRIANSTPLSNTNVSWTAFASTWAPTNVQILESPFTFSDGASGKVVSIAYFSTGGVTNGKWVYAYQVVFQSGGGKLTAISIEPAGPPTTVVVGGTPTPNFSFITVKPSGATEFQDLTTGGVTVNSGDYTDSELIWVFQAPGISSGQNSVVFGYVSDLPPTKVSADLSKVNGSADLSSKPFVLVASPEPSTLLLLGLGLIGGCAFRKRQRKFMVSTK